MKLVTNVFLVMLIVLVLFASMTSPRQLVTTDFFDVSVGGVSFISSVLDNFTVPVKFLFEVGDTVNNADSTGYVDDSKIIVERFVFKVDAFGNLLTEPIYIDIVDNGIFSQKILFSNDSRVNSCSLFVLGRRAFKKSTYDETGQLKVTVLYQEPVWWEKSDCYQGKTDKISYGYYKMFIRDNPDYFTLYCN